MRLLVLGLRRVHPPSRGKAVAQQGEECLGVPNPRTDLLELAERLAKWNSGAEANRQADVRTLLLYGGLNLGDHAHA